jgi:hypothetical protein
MRLRFTISRLMGVVLIAAILLTAWQLAGKAAANIILNLTVLVLIVATYKAKFASGRDGAWWLGFATLGWAHLGLWVATNPWQHFYRFRLILITDVVYWVLAANVGFPQLADDLRFDPEEAKARTILVECLTATVAGLIGAWSFSFAALVGARRTQRAGSTGKKAP